MSTIITNSDNYANIAMAIREKLQTTKTYKPSEMSLAINDINGNQVYIDGEEYTNDLNLTTSYISGKLIYFIS